MCHGTDTGLFFKEPLNVLKKKQPIHQALDTLLKPSLKTSEGVFAFFTGQIAILTNKGQNKVNLR
jgi:hypothetical protein